jgi:hypothetical protein
MDNEKQSVFDKLEAFYLSAMRKALLVFSTILFAYAAVVGISSLYKVSRSADSVEEAKPDVKTADIIPIRPSTASVDQTAATSSGNKFQKDEKSPFDEHASRMFTIWQTKFEIHKKSGDPKLSESEFTDWYEGAWYNFDKPEWCSNEDCTEAELAAFASDLGLAETAISAAGDDASLSARMAATSSGQQDGYDNVFVDLNRNFWTKLSQLRQANREEAAAKRAEIAAGKVAGGIGLVTAGWAFVAFISLMFSFLLVAVERHQRQMASDIERIKANLESD